MKDIVYKARQLSAAVNCAASFHLRRRTAHGDSGSRITDGGQRLPRIALTASLAIGPLFIPLLAEAACTTPKDPYLNPFSKKSAHHRPIGTGAQYASPTHPSTNSWFRNTKRSININVGAPWGVSVASADAADPFRTVAAAKCSGTKGLPKTIRMPREGFITPMHSTCSDGVAVIYDRTQRLPHELRQYNWNGGRPTAGVYKTWSITGLGHGTRPGERLGTTATGVAFLFGILRGDEINNPSRKVEHALQMILPSRPDHCAMMMSREIVLPAVTGDGYMTNPGNNLGNIPYGALMALPPPSKGGPNLDTMGLTARGKRIAEAVRDYGIYAVDTGGCVALRSDQYVQNTSELKAALSKIYPYIRRVLNNNVLGTSTAGGGAGLAANCANDA